MSIKKHTFLSPITAYTDNNGFILSTDLTFSFNNLAYTSLETVNKMMRGDFGERPE